MNLSTRFIKTSHSHFEVGFAPRNVHPEQKFIRRLRLSTGLRLLTPHVQRILISTDLRLFAEDEKSQLELKNKIFLPRDKAHNSNNLA